MGQKISPTALRIGITQNWSSTWYATKKDYGKLVVEDDKIRKFVKKEYNFVGISRIDIERNRDKITVFVHAARPGLLLGRRGAKVDKLSEDLMALIKKPIDLKV
ncbi:MAG: 30S ribosomal protein S3, partial [Planctomycetes bacterium]|nr:30S ribosomal protein S3 [Planctomycetota bacterium]